MRFRVTIDGRLVSTSGSIDNEARDALSLAMEELNKLGSAPGNASIDLDSTTGEIRISCSVEAPHAGRAVQPASDQIVLALRQGRIATPDWPDVEDSHWRVDLIDSRAVALV